MIHIKSYTKFIVLLLFFIIIFTSVSSITALAQNQTVTPKDSQPTNTNQQIEPDQETEPNNESEPRQEPEPNQHIEPEPKPVPKAQAVITDDISDNVTDQNQNELYDYIIIRITIKIDIPGYYELGSKLILNDGRPLMYVYKDFRTESEFIELQLRYDGKLIYSSEVSGPYMCELWLMNETGEIISSIEYKTAEYDYRNFEHGPPPIEMVGRSGDTGVDRDSNELFDLLSIHYTIQVNEPGSYTFLAGLFKEIIKDGSEEPFYYLISVSRLILDLDPGNNTIKMNFLGSKIHLSKYDGPYHVGLWISHTDPNDMALYEKSNDRESYDAVLLDIYQERFRWPMAGEGDFSGERILKTKEYIHTQFEEPPKIAEFTKRVRESKLDQDKDGLIDHLVLNVEVNIKEPGEYLIWGRILTGDDLENIEISAKNLTHLREGTYYITLKFNGFEIHKAELKGILKVGLTIKGQHLEGFPVIDKFNYLTINKYSYDKFESQPDKEYPDKSDDEIRPNAKLDSEGIVTKTNVMEIYTPRTQPEITFWFADTKDSDARFKLLFQRLIGYTDLNNNDVYDFGEEHFEVFLEDSHWEIDNLVYSVNEKYGNYVEFRLYSDVLAGIIQRIPEKNIDDTTKELNNEPLSNTRQLNEKTLETEYSRLDYMDVWASIEFKFLITSNNFLENNPFSYEINGDTEMKIDINIKIHKPIDIDGICIEQILFDEEKMLGFLTKEKDGDLTYLPGQTHNNMSLRNFEFESTQEKQWVIFVDESGKEYGFYSWIPKVNVTYYDGTSKIVDISSSYTTDGFGFRLFTNYPYSRDITAIEHFPSIGMIEENRPPQRLETTNGLVEMLFNPFVYIIASLGAVAFIFFLRTGQMRDKKGKGKGTGNGTGKPKEPKDEFQEGSSRPMERQTGYTHQNFERPDFSNSRRHPGFKYK